MKRIPSRMLPVLGWLLLLALGFGCKKKEASVTFEVADSIQYYSMALSEPPEVQYLPTRQVYSKIEEASALNSTAPGRVQSATLSSAELTITGAPGQNFDFLRLITVYLIDAQGVNRGVLAQSASIPAGATRLLLTPTSESMVGYLKAGQYYLKPAVQLQPAAQVVANMQLKLSFQVQARQN